MGTMQMTIADYFAIGVLSLNAMARGTAVSDAQVVMRSRSPAMLMLTCYAPEQTTDTKRLC
jgi:hypothetical protein